MRARSSLFPGWGIPEFAMTATLMLIAGVAHAGPFFFSTGTVNNLMATASRPDTLGKFEIEAADDFILTGSQTSLTSATFTGLLTGASPTIGEVRVEIYRVFPNDSDVGRTPQVPTRVNSPSDVALDDRDSTVGGGLSFTTTVLTLVIFILEYQRPRASRFWSSSLRCAWISSRMRRFNSASCSGVREAWLSQPSCARTAHRGAVVHGLSERELRAADQADGALGGLAQRSEIVHAQLAGICSGV